MVELLPSIQSNVLRGRIRRTDSFKSVLESDCLRLPPDLSPRDLYRMTRTGRAARTLDAQKERTLGGILVVLGPGSLRLHLTQIRVFPKHWKM